MHSMRAGSFALALTIVAFTPGSEADARIYGVKTCFSAPGVAAGCDATPGDHSDPPSSLFSFLEDGTGFIDHGIVTLGGAQIDVDALAMSGLRHLFGFQVIADGASSRLMRIDTLTAVATAVGGEHVGRNIRGAVFDLTDRLWVIDVSAESLLRIDPVTGAVMPGSERVFSFGGGAIDIETGTDLAVSADGTVRLGQFNTALGRPEFYVVDVATGALTLEFFDPVGEPDSPASLFFPGITFSGDGAASALYAYEANGQEDVYRYDLPAYARSEIIANFIPSYNAGRGDLAAFMEPLSEAVPEPATMMILGAALTGLAASRGRWTRRLSNHSADRGQPSRRALTY